MNYSNNPHDFNYPLLYLDDNTQNAWTLEHGTKGVGVLGMTGSGKTSSIGKYFIRAMLNAGYGALFLTVKPDDCANYVAMCKACGRMDDVIVFSEKNRWRFSFLQEEATRTSDGGGTVNSLIELLLVVYEIVQKQQSQGQRGDDSFWKGALVRLLNRLLLLLQLAEEPIEIKHMYNAVTSAPQNREAFADDAWVQSSYLVDCLVKAESKCGSSEAFALIDSYWTREFPGFDDKTRSIVVESALSILEPFMTGLLNKMLASEHNISPTLALEGQIIILDFPVVNYLETGVFIQGIFKYNFQRTAERRNTTAHPNPVLLFIDEFQYFVSKHDFLFQTTARSSKTICIYMTQNISNIYAVMGGGRFKEMTDSLMSNLATKCYLANSDAVSNKWAAENIGSTFQYVSNFHSSMAQKGASAGAGQQLIHQVLPIEFTRLRTGGIAHHYQVDCLISIAGHLFEDGKNYKKVTFDQRA